MSFFNTISYYLGSSSKHADKASTHLSQATNHFVDGLSNTKESVAPLFTSHAFFAGFAAWNSYEYIAGKIIGANAATQLANCMASVVGCAQVTSYLAQATEMAALSLVTHPVGCMAALLATSILATHPKETFNAIKHLGKAAFNFAEAGLDIAEATGEAILALAAKIAETLADDDDNEWIDVDQPEYIEMQEIAVDPLGGLYVEAETLEVIMN